MQPQSERTLESLKSPQSTVKRGPKRALYDRQTVNDILDSTLVCHIAQQKEGQVFVTPNCHWREGEYLYWHGHSKARNASGTAAESVCINVCALDGLVLARCAFNHSINYRSVTLFGVPELVEEMSEKARHLQLMVDKISPGRWDSLRPMTANEVNATAVMRIRIDNASAKVRTGDPLDDKDDLDWPVFAGTMPLERQWGEPVAAANCTVAGEPRCPDAF